jgi:hypothetical protein
MTDTNNNYSLNDTLHTWVQLDKAIQKLREKLKDYTQRKEKLEEDLISQTLSEQGGEVQYNLNDEVVSIHKQNFVQPFNQKQLMYLLKKYFDSDGEYDYHKILDYLISHNQRSEIFRASRSTSEGTSSDQT